MELVGDRIVVRTPNDDDAAALVDAVQASLPELMPWLPWATPSYGTADAIAWIRGEVGDSPPLVVVGPDGAVIGTCSLNRMDEVNNNANLGYWIRTDRTGNGFASEAVRLVADYGLNTAGFNRLYLLISTKNEGSIAVAERSGAVFEGVSRQSYKLPDGMHDCRVYSFIPGDLCPSLGEVSR